MMNSNKTSARLFGVFFLIAFVSYGTGSGIIESLSNSPNGLPAIYAHKNQLIFSGVLMAVLHTFANLGLVVIMVPVFKNYNRAVTYGYLGAAIIATVMLVAGTVFLLLLVPLSDLYMQTDIIGETNFETIQLLCKKANFFCYQLGMAIWGFGGLLFCYLLRCAKIASKTLVIWGISGYLVFIAGTMLELFGYPVGIYLSIPGGLFEIFLSIWFIVKGFDFSKTDVLKSNH